MASFAYDEMGNPCSQFHKRFAHAFFIQKLLFGSFSSYVLALVPKFRLKNEQILMTLTPGVNVINTICARFLYERHFGSFFIVDVRTKNPYV